MTKENIDLQEAVVRQNIERLINGWRGLVGTEVESKFDFIPLRTFIAVLLDKMN